MLGAEGPLSADRPFGTAIALAVEPVAEYSTVLGAGTSSGTNWGSILLAADSLFLFGTDAAWASDESGFVCSVMAGSIVTR